MLRPVGSKSLQLNSILPYTLYLEIGYLLD